MLEMSEYRVLDVCRAVIEQLAVEKAALQEMNIRLLMLSPPAPIIVKIGKSDLPGSQD